MGAHLPPQPRQPPSSKLTDWNGTIERLEHALNLVVRGKPLRDMAETLGESAQTKTSIEAELKAMDHQALEDCMAATRLDPLVIARLTAALADAPDMASVTVLAGDLRKLLNQGNGQ